MSMALLKIAYTAGNLGTFIASVTVDFLLVALALRRFRSQRTLRIRLLSRRNDLLNLHFRGRVPLLSTTRPEDRASTNDDDRERRTGALHLRLTGASLALQSSLASASLGRLEKQPT